MRPKKSIFSLCAGRFGQHLVVNPAAAYVQRRDRQPVVFGRPGHHGVGHQGEAPDLLSLLFEVNSGVRPRRSASPRASAHCGSARMSWIINVLMNPRQNWRDVQAEHGQFLLSAARTSR